MGERAGGSVEIDKDDLTEVTEAVAGGDMPRAAGAIAGVVVGAAAGAAGLGVSAAIPAALGKKLVEAIASRLSTDPATERMLSAGRALDERRAYVREIAVSAVRELGESGALRELAADDEARFHQLIKFLSRNVVDELKAGQDRIQSALDERDRRIQDLYEAFRLAPKPIADGVRVAEFRTIVEDRTKTFVGREWLLAKIDQLIERPPFESGYLILRGEPGIGKTAIMSKLVFDKGYVHHFNVAAQNIRSTEDFLRNVCGQIIVRYDLPYGTLPAGAAKDSGFLSRLLAEASAASNGAPVVVLVDALDEAELPTSERGNTLALPPSLPDKVHFVVSARPNAAERLYVERREDLVLDDADPNNVRDVARYIESFIDTHRAEMTARLETWKASPADFADALVHSSEGNFMYLVHVLGDVLHGRLTPTTLADLRSLPKGLRAYYKHHWRTMQVEDRARFTTYYEPVLCVLASAREPVTLAQLREWTGLEAARVAEVLSVWTDFLDTIASESGATTYRLYHASFRDFLAAEVGLDAYHAMIAKSALAKINW
jgi:hypothetical protein